MAKSFELPSDFPVTEREVELLRKLGFVGGSLQKALHEFAPSDGNTEEVTESALAEAVLQVAMRLEGPDHRLLFQIALALECREPEYRLKLGKVTRGQRRSGGEEFENATRSLDWYGWVAEGEQSGVKTEAIVAEIMEREAVGRSTVFAALSEAEELLAVLDRINYKVSVARRPAK